jgi:hypothetical protein
MLDFLEIQHMRLFSDLGPQLLDEPDWDIYYWATNKKQPPPKWEGTALLDKLRVHAKNEGKVVRSMPALGGWTSSLSASPGTSKQ